MNPTEIPAMMSHCSSTSSRQGGKRRSGDNSNRSSALGTTRRIDSQIQAIAAKTCSSQLLSTACLCLGLLKTTSACGQDLSCICAATAILANTQA
jgi:hypothetical protein